MWEKSWIKHIKNYKGNPTDTAHRPTEQRLKENKTEQKQEIKPNILHGGTKRHWARPGCANKIKTLTLNFRPYCRIVDCFWRGGLRNCANNYAKRENRPRKEVRWVFGERCLWWCIWCRERLLLLLAYARSFRSLCEIKQERVGRKSSILGLQFVAGVTSSTYFGGRIPIFCAIEITYSWYRTCNRIVRKMLYEWYIKIRLF